jgi:hypothetical protein
MATEGDHGRKYVKLYLYSITRVNNAQTLYVENVTLYDVFTLAGQH